MSKLTNVRERQHQPFLDTMTPLRMEELTVSLRSDVISRARAFCAARDMSLAGLVARALDEYIDQRTKRTSKRRKRKTNKTRRKRTKR